MYKNHPTSYIISRCLFHEVLFTSFFTWSYFRIQPKGNCFLIFSLPHLSLPPLFIFALFSPHSLALLMHSHTCSHTLAFLLLHALALSLPPAYFHLPSHFPFLLPSPILLCLNFWLGDFYCII